ncbi:MAG: 3-oxoacyl-[acyl-carrier-protein] reductase [Deltaproteobacteria bacterium]|nr:3-oxoacyl-[acyl-carrier-protein] reductase [Deltaproteobacteria bacterium]
MTKAKRTIVVTGGSRGIGRAISLEFADSDICVYFNYLSNKAEADKTITLIKKAGGCGYAFKADISVFDEVKTFFDKIFQHTEKIDILVNNAGISKNGLIPLLKESDWDKTINTNLKGIFLCTKIAAKKMIRQKYGRIINISSVVGFTGSAGQAGYSASKAGIIAFTKSAAQELASRNITVNAVAPGFINTDMTRALTEKVKKKIVAKIPLEKIGEDRNVADAVKFLSSEQASYITGQVIHVNGGMYM